MTFAQSAMAVPTGNTIQHTGNSGCRQVEVDIDRQSLSIKVIHYVKRPKSVDTD